MEKLTVKWYNCTMILDIELNSGHKIMFNYLLFTTSNYKLKSYIFCYWIYPFEIILLEDVIEDIRTKLREDLIIIMINSWRIRDV